LPAGYAERFNDGAESEGIESAIHLDDKVPARMNTDSGLGPGHSLWKQLQKTPGTERLSPESASPGMELTQPDPSVPAKVGNVQAPCCLVLDDGAPMGSPFLFGHCVFPPVKEIFLSGRL
jgi:hypothetical protein